ncbi:VIT1/CCC1 transporter family protein [Alphaproteobacteria bacterium]|nr:VIT1/CCC1 transporter family protein [Alphaproteobacteria bacterium]
MGSKLSARDWVHGGVDGVVAIFAIVCGVVVFNTSTNVILVLGGANIISDGFSITARKCTRSNEDFDKFNRIFEHGKR